MRQSRSQRKVCYVSVLGSRMVAECSRIKPGCRMPTALTLRTGNRVAALDPSLPPFVGGVGYLVGVDARWPDSDVRKMQSGDDGWYMGSAVCRRGHVETDYIDPRRGGERTVARIRI
jgi:hypothetical protein